MQNEHYAQHTHEQRAAPAALDHSVQCQTTKTMAEKRATRTSRASSRAPHGGFGTTRTKEFGPEDGIAGKAAARGEAKRQPMVVRQQAHKSGSNAR